MIRPIVVLLVFPLLCRHFWALPKLTVCPFRPPSWPFLHTLLQNTTFRGKMSNLDAINTTKLGTKRQKDKWFHFHAHPKQIIFPAFLCSGNPHNPKKSPSVPCAALEPKLRDKSIRICSPPISQSTQTDAGVQLMWERVLCNSCAINSPNIVSCNRLRVMSLHISEN